MSSSQRNYCFTNYTGQRSQRPLHPDVRYLIEGNEICPDTGRQHFQSYVEFHKKITIKKAQEILGLPNVHMEKRYGPRENARDYCKKDKDFLEEGSWEAGGRGARTDLIFPKCEKGPSPDECHAHNTRKLLDDIEAGYTDFQILQENAYSIYKYNTFIQRARSILTEENSKKALDNYKNIELNDKQKIMLDHLKKQDDRQVTWICDPKGKTGKTWLSKYLIATDPEDCIRFENGKTKDIAYAYNGQNTIIFDFSRTLDGRVNYSIIESLKNGMLFSGKYNSTSKIFEIPKIIILANFAPDFSALSEDRWDYVFFPPA